MIKTVGKKNINASGLKRQKIIENKDHLARSPLIAK